MCAIQSSLGAVASRSAQGVNCALVVANSHAHSKLVDNAALNRGRPAVRMRLLRKSKENDRSSLDYEATNFSKYLDTNCLVFPFYYVEI